MTIAKMLAEKHDCPAEKSLQLALVRKFVEEVYHKRHLFMVLKKFMAISITLAHSINHLLPFALSARESGSSDKPFSSASPLSALKSGSPVEPLTFRIK